MFSGKRSTITMAAVCVSIVILVTLILITGDTGLKHSNQFVQEEAESNPVDKQAEGELVNTMKHEFIDNKVNEQNTEMIEVQPKRALGKEIGHGNPLVSHKFGADPYALVYDNRVYLYMTADEFDYDEQGHIKNNSYGNIHKLSVISSSDLVNWTDHGYLNVAGSEGAAKWATQSWAPAVAHKSIDGNDKFFLYFANNASGIGVLTSDSPLGPWIDPIEKPLIARNSPAAAGVTWLFDPAVLVDDDGKGYLYYGGGIPEGQDEMPNTARVIQLGEDMISVVGEAVTIPAPYMFESAGINKINGTYMYTYSSNFFAGARPEGSPEAGVIAYMTSQTPMGPWTYKGTILKNPAHFFGVGGNNHQVIFKFQEQLYIAYHAQTLAKDLNEVKGYRSTHLNQVHIDENGDLEEIKADYKGVAQFVTLNPYLKVEAETMAWQAGIHTEPIAHGETNKLGNQVVSGIHRGDWIAVTQADFGDQGAVAFAAHVLPGSFDATIEVRLNAPDGEKVAILAVPASHNESINSYISIETTVATIKGVHDVYFIFQGNSEEELFKWDSWVFKQ